MKSILTALSLLFLLASCQKEITSDNLVPISAGGGSSGGTANGDLLVKALEISPSTSDTNVITFQWDAANRLLSYISAGKVQGIATNFSYIITRGSDGKIKTIVSKTSGGTSFADSAVYTYTYVSGSNKIAYILSTQATAIGDINDSAAIGYDASGKVSSKEVFSDLFTGSWDPSTKEVYAYDAAGNVIKTSSYAANYLTGGYDLSGETINTFDGHKAAVSLGDECFAVLGANNVSKNHNTGLTTNAVASGTTYTGTLSQFQFNSFDRPSTELLSVTPQPPGYNEKLLYYYK